MKRSRNVFKMLKYVPVLAAVHRMFVLKIDALSPRTNQSVPRYPRGLPYLNYVLRQ